jgi:hypothetical protein
MPVGPVPAFKPAQPPIPLGAAGTVLTSTGTDSQPAFQASGGGGGIGTELVYAPADGDQDPGEGIAGFGSGVGILLLTLSGPTTFAGLPAGTGRQQLLLCILPASTAGSTLTLPSGASTEGAPFLNSAGSAGFEFQIGDTLQCVYSPTEESWLLLV